MAEAGQRQSASKVADLKKAEPKTKTERLSVNITQATADALRELATRKGMTLTEVVRRAVTVLKLLEDEQLKGTEVQLYSPGSESVRTLTLV